MPQRVRALIKAKGWYTKYWCIYIHSIKRECLGIICEDTHMFMVESWMPPINYVRWRYMHYFNALYIASYAIRSKFSVIFRLSNHDMAWQSKQIKWLKQNAEIQGIKHNPIFINQYYSWYHRDTTISRPKMPKLISCLLVVYRCIHFLGAGTCLPIICSLAFDGEIHQARSRAARFPIVRLFCKFSVPAWKNIALAFLARTFGVAWTTEDLVEHALHQKRVGNLLMTIICIKKFLSQLVK